jgi:hypothetical protein
LASPHRPTDITTRLGLAPKTEIRPLDGGTPHRSRDGLDHALLGNCANNTPVRDLAEGGLLAQQRNIVLIGGAGIVEPLDIAERI